MKRRLSKLLVAMATVALAAGLSIPALAFASGETVATVEDPNGEITEFADLQEAFDYAASFSDPEAEYGEMVSIYLQDDVDLGDGYISIQAAGFIDIYLIADGFNITSVSPECTIEVGDKVHLQITGGVVSNNASSGKAVVINHYSFFLGEPDFGDDSVLPACLVAGEGIDCALLNQSNAWADLDNAIVKGGDYAVINYGDLWVSDAIVTGDIVTDDILVDDSCAYLAFWNGTLNGGLVAGEGGDGAEVDVLGGRFSTDPTEYVDMESGWYLMLGPVDNYWIVSSIMEDFTKECPRDEDCQLVFYEDTDPNAWYHDGVEWVVCMGIMEGYVPEGELFADKFGPMDTLTREQFAVIMCRFAESLNFDMTVGDFVELEFRDAAKISSWAEDSIKWAVATGILRGYGDGSILGPQDGLTREQLATMMLRFAEYAAMDTSAGEDSNLLSYKDFDKIGDYAIEAMQWAVGEGIISGYTDANGEPNGYLGPQDKCQRAQAATMLMRFYYSI
ncbi:MAG: S-layer homology domain-containing protein [Eggerthellaceae bacterium]|nr:S-layer homology domain-containing protein [Eggerthellaceae bacterium]